MKNNIKIALVIDVENWAFANIARHFKKELNNMLNIDIVSMSRINNNAAVMWLILKKYDVVHFFCRGLSISYCEEYIKPLIYEMGGNPTDFYNNYVKGKVITTCVYDHLFLEEPDILFTKKLFNKINNYYVSSNKLKQIYNNLEIQNKPKCVITDGIDLEKFYPINTERFNQIDNRTIKIGWVGNSNWVDNGIDYKGLNTIIKPAIEELQKEGLNVELFTVDKINATIPINEMVNYYSKIDIYVCASLAEGTPNPVLESMACGVPIISTDVGIVQDALGQQQKEFILDSRSIECLKAKIKLLVRNKSKLQSLSKENLENIKVWDWKYKAEEFKNFILNACK
jgi:glycosyltransferase involved in cell wall biosynthesis